MEFMVIFYLFHIIIFIIVFVILKIIQIVMKKEEIQSILSNVYLDIRTIDYAIKSYKKDVKKLTIKNERFMLSLSVYKRIWN